MQSPNNRGDKVPTRHLNFTKYKEWATSYWVTGQKGLIGHLKHHSLKPRLLVALSLMVRLYCWRQCLLMPLNWCLTRSIHYSYWLAFTVLKGSLQLPEGTDNHQHYQATKPEATIIPVYKANWCNSDTNIMGVMSHILIGFKFQLHEIEPIYDNNLRLDRSWPSGENLLLLFC